MITSRTGDITASSQQPKNTEEEFLADLQLAVEEAYRGDPASDDAREGGSNDEHRALNAAQAQQQRLCHPTCSCAKSTTSVRAHRQSQGES